MSKDGKAQPYNTLSYNSDLSTNRKVEKRREFIKQSSSFSKMLYSRHNIINQRDREAGVLVIALLFIKKNNNNEYLKRASR